jgi:NhaP-type Na+/H+ or K+/H+ antiporter
MLFAAGFNLKKKAFVKNMSYISMFGILGTFVFFVLIVMLLLWANQLSKPSFIEFRPCP